MEVTIRSVVNIVLLSKFYLGRVAGLLMHTESQLRIPNFLEVSIVPFLFSHQW